MRMAIVSRASARTPDEPDVRAVVLPRDASPCRTLLSVICVLMIIAGCNPRGSSGDVLGAFGHTGLGPGDFTYPRAIAVEPGGGVFIVDKSGRVQRFSTEGIFEHGWTMPAIEQGKPVGLSVHPDGRLFVADTHYHRVVILDRDGVVLGGFGEEGDGPGQMRLPTDVAFGADGDIYVTEYGGNDRVTHWTADGDYRSAFGEEPIDGRRLNRPAAIEADSEGTLWVADACNHRIVAFSPDGRVQRRFGSFGDQPGQMRYPYDLCLTRDGTIMVCEYEGNRLQWFDRDGRSLRTWGRRGRGAGELFAPWGAACGTGDRVYIVDSLNDRIQIVRP
jgi:DNA-binding beta-propeller fold protein YncE